MEVHKNKKASACDFDLETNTQTKAFDETVLLADRIARYGGAKSRALSMLEYLQSLPAAPYATKYGTRTREAVPTRVTSSLGSCASYLHFREYFTVGKVRLHSAQFCKQHLICPMCAIRRGSKALGAYLEKYQIIKQERPELKPYLLTLTILNGQDLEERQRHLEKSLRTLMTRRRLHNSSPLKNSFTELCKAEAAVYTMELTNKGNGWHPHVHMIVLSASRIDSKALSAEWLAITKDSMIVDCRPITGDPVQGFMEVFKYAVKFSDLSLADNWHAAQVLKGKRLMNSFGLFRGVEVPDDLLDEPLDDLPYWDRFYRFFNGSYHLTGEAPRTE